MRRKLLLTDAAVMHEAGHAVAGVLLDRPYAAISMLERRARVLVHGRPAILIYAEGIVGLPGAPGQAGPDDRAGVPGDAVVCRMAGLAAETLGAAWDPSHLGGALDWGYVVEAVRRGGAGRGVRARRTPRRRSRSPLTSSRPAGRR